MLGWWSLMAGIKVIKRKSMSLKNAIAEYNKPEIVYIPLVNHSNMECVPTVKTGDIVLKGAVICKRNDHIQLDIHSSVSGKVLEIGKCLYLNGELVPCVVIENDFKEIQEHLNEKRAKINTYSKQEFIDTIKKYAVTGMGGADFPTYIKYMNELDTIIVNAVECEPYNTSDHMTATLRTEEILETIDAIMEINKMKKAYIAIKENNEELKKTFAKYLGTYPNITLFLVKDVYPAGWEKQLIEEILNKTYEKVPSEIKVVCNNVSTIYAIYKALKYHKSISRRIVTVTGKMVKEPKNVIVKLGAKMSDVMKEIGGYQEGEEYLFVAGGPMMGEAMPSEDLVVTKNLTSVIVLDRRELPKTVTCLRCGRCSDVCPANISPVLIMNKVSDFDELKKMHPEKCIECGLCSYICPSKIMVREFVRKAKREIRRH